MGRAGMDYRTVDERLGCHRFFFFFFFFLMALDKTIPVSLVSYLPSN